MSWFAKIRSIAALGAVVTTGLVAGAFLSVSSAKERKAKSTPAAEKHPDGGAADAKAEPRKRKGKRKRAKPDAEKVRRAQPIPRDYVE